MKKEEDGEDCGDASNDSNDCWNPKLEASVDKLMQALKRDYLLFINNYKSDTFR